MILTMYHRIFRFSSLLCTTTLLLLLSTIPQRPGAAQAPKSLLSVPQKWTPSYAWMTEPWGDRDTEFLVIAGRTKREMAVSKDVRKLVRTYQSAALRDLAQRRLVYQWAYAESQLLLDSNSWKIDRNHWKGIFMSLVRAVSPQDYMFHDSDGSFRKLAKQKKLPKPVRSYRYSRMLFVAACAGGLDGGRLDAPRYARLGDRLLKLNPADELVKLLTVRHHSHNKKAGVDNAKAVQYGKELVKEHPNKLSYLIVLAQAQISNWDFERNDQGATDAMGTYQIYMDRSPKNDKMRKYVAGQMSNLRWGISEWRKRRERKKR